MQNTLFFAIFNKKTHFFSKKMFDCKGKIVNLQTKYRCIVYILTQSITVCVCRFHLLVRKVCCC